MNIRIPITPLDPKEILRYAGGTGGAFPPELLTEAALEGRLLADAKGSVRHYPYCESRYALLAEDGEFLLTGERIRAHLAGADEAALFAVTIGNALEQQAAAYFQQNHYTQALLLEAAGAAAAEAAADYLNRLIAEDAKKRGRTTAFRFSPGYGDWPLTAQPSVVRLSEGDKIGISVTESSMLLPRKSVTALIPLFPQDKKGAAAPPRCTACKQRNCLARKETTP